MEGLTDIDNIFLDEFLSNKEMTAAVRKALELAVTQSEASNPRINDYSRKLVLTLNNEELGADLRARTKALEALEVGFSLLSAKTPESKTTNINPAR